MSLFYRQNAAARFFVDQTNGKVYEGVGSAAVLVKSCNRRSDLPLQLFDIIPMFT